MGIGSHRTEKVPKKSYLIGERSELRLLRDYIIVTLKMFSFLLTYQKLKHKEVQRCVMRRRQTEILSCAWDLSVSPESFSLAPAFFGEQAAHAQHKTVSGTGAQKIHCDTGNNGQTPDLYRSMFCPTKLQVQSLSIVQGFHKSFSFVLMNISHFHGSSSVASENTVFNLKGRKFWGR